MDRVSTKTMAPPRPTRGRVFTKPPRENFRQGDEIRPAPALVLHGDVQVVEGPEGGGRRARALAGGDDRVAEVLGACAALGPVVRRDGGRRARIARLGGYEGQLLGRVVGELVHGNHNS